MKDMKKCEMKPQFSHLENAAYLMPRFDIVHAYVTPY